MKPNWIGPIVACFALTLAFAGEPAQRARNAQSNAPLCLAYEPKVVTLIGTIRRQTFPGPPNYENVQKGDRPETYWMLSLEVPVCVTKDAKDPELNPAKQSVSELQLVLNDQKAYGKYGRFLGHRVIVRGALFGGITGHHHTEVLITVQSIERAKGGFPQHSYLVVR